jgi:hypothetical protein
MMLVDVKADDFLRERMRETIRIAIACARPKDLLSAFAGLDWRRGAGPTVLPARSFGRRSGTFVRDGAAWRLPQEISLNPAM